MNDIIKKLKEYFEKKENIAFAFLFGSFSKGRSTKISDIDIAIYYFPENNEIDFESEKYFDDELEIWGNLEAILKKEVDLVVLNRAASTVAYNAIRGKKIIIKDYDLYYKFFTYVLFSAIDYNEMILSE